MKQENLPGYLIGRLLEKDTTKGYVEASVSLMKDAEGNPAGFRRYCTRHHRKQADRGELDPRPKISYRTS